MAGGVDHRHSLSEILDAYTNSIKNGDNQIQLLVVVIVVIRLACSISTCLECCDLRLDTGLTLLVGKTSLLVFERLCLPIFCLFCRLEGGVFPDSGVCVLENLFDIFRPDAISEVCRELLLKSKINNEQLFPNKLLNEKKRTARHLPPPNSPYTQQRDHQRYISSMSRHLTPCSQDRNRGNACQNEE